MSRDWTPREFYYADKKFNFKEMNITIEIPTTGQKFPMVSETKQKLTKEYPNFGFLYERAEELWNILPENTREKTFNKIDSRLTEIIEKDKMSDDILSQWYFGRLDKGFYYREQNDELLFEYLTDSRK